MSDYLTTDDLLVARRIFELEIHRHSGQAFETFFTRIMKLHNPEFNPVKPQGSIGDRKNDGFIQSAGIYYQVYSPEDPSTKQKETIEKLTTDFEGLYNYWQPIYPINEFYFVLNDKGNGPYPTLYPEMAAIQKKYNLQQCKPFLMHQLEDIFFKLPHDQIEAVIGKIPSPDNIVLDNSVLNDVIEHLMNIKSAYSPDSIPVNPNFDAKILFNEIKGIPEAFLRSGSYHEGTLKEWFTINSTFSKEHLRRTFNNLYKEGAAKHANSENKAELIFFHVLKNACPEASIAYDNAVLVLMAYFFDYCDIFEEPPVQQKKVS